MNKNLTNLFSLVLVNLLPYLINFLILPIYSRHIDPEGFGVIGLVMACVVLAAAWSGMQLSGALSRFFFDYKGEDLRVYVSTLVYASFVITCIFCLFYYGVFDQISSLIFHGEIENNVIYLGIFLVYLSVTNTLLERLLINEGKGKYILYRSFIAQVFSISSGVYLIVYLQQGVVGFLTASVVYYLALILFSFSFVRHYFTPKFDMKFARESLRYSFPLIFHAVGGVVFMYSTVFFIENLLALAAVGLFFIADKFSQIIKAIVNATNNVVMPIYNKLSIEDTVLGKEFIDTLVPVWFAVVLCGTLNFSFLAQAFISDFMGESYEDLVLIILVMSLSYLFRGFYCFSVAPLFFFKKTRVIPRITILTGFVSLIINYVLISLLGLEGAALAIFFSFFVNFVFSLFYSQNEFKINYSVSSLSLLFLLICAVNLPVLYIIKGVGFYLFFLVSVFLFTLTNALIYFCDFCDMKARVAYLRKLK